MSKNSFKNLHKKLKDFILTNRFSKKVRIVFHKHISPFFVKLIIISLAFLISAFLTLKFFKPDYLDKIYHKASFYFYHYLKLSNDEFKEINITGNKRVKKSEIIAIIDAVKESRRQQQKINQSTLIHDLIDEIKTKLPWIDKITINRSMPSTLNISIIEYQPFAIWKNRGKKFVIDKEGNSVPIETLEGFKNLIILSGRNANIHVRSLFNIFTIDPELSANVYSANWIGNRRWDIRLENGLLIKLPNRDISKSWENLIKIYKMPGSVVGLKVIDLRIPHKIYLEYNDSVIKELKNI